MIGLNMKTELKASSRGRGSRKNHIFSEDKSVGSVWADRCSYWAEQLPLTKIDRRRKRSERPSLILTGHGVYMRVERGTLLVRNGLTHYPQQHEEWRFFPGEWRAPSKIIVIDAKGSITFEALRWLAAQNAELLHLDWRGEVVHAVGGSGYAIDRRSADAQLEARQNGARLKICQRLIADKITNSIATLREALPQSEEIDGALRKLEKDAVEIRRAPPKSVSGFLGIEGRVAQTYFGAWRTVPLRWAGTGRRAIPDDWLFIGQRQSMAPNKLSNRNRNASHPVNAMLNYAYGVLRNIVHRHVVAAGLDPSVGYLHGNYGDREALVFDLMEPLRPIADRAVLEFATEHVFEPADFSLNKHGVCRLNPHLTRAMVKAILHKEISLGPLVAETNRTLRTLNNEARPR